MQVGPLSLCGVCSAVMLVGAKNGNISVGEVEKDHKDEVFNQSSSLGRIQCMHSRIMQEHHDQLPMSRA